MVTSIEPPLPTLCIQWFKGKVEGLIGNSSLVPAVGCLPGLKKPGPSRNWAGGKARSLSPPQTPLPPTGSETLLYHSGTTWTVWSRRERVELGDFSPGSKHSLDTQRPGQLG